VRLPEEFAARMEGFLKAEWKELLAAWEGPSHQGLRVNTLKIGVKDFLSRAPFALEPVPWTKDGFYVLDGERPARHPYYQAGLYYLQEPSAMAPAACLGVKPGDKVLDLCAAPGGKSTQLVSLLRGEGLLLSNDNNPKRVKALVWNLEHWGASNTAVTNEEPARLAAYFPEFFDKILVDAPCSGEGMFRKDGRAAGSWSSYGFWTCVAVQKELLAAAALMLKKGGRMLYSTCTFSPEENEGVVEHFLQAHPHFSLLDIHQAHDWDPGRPEWLADAGWDCREEFREELRKTRRLWPHRARGEGHFMALLEKREEDCGRQMPPRAGADGSRPVEPFRAFMEKNLVRPIEGEFIQQGHYVYRRPPGLILPESLKIPRPGWFMGIVKNGRFEPSQAMAMGLRREHAARSVSFEINDRSVERYLRRETLLTGGPKGWTLVCLEEFPLGWAKQTGEHLKNCYPPGWRRTC
jgi:NOL1/NOP2/sun family putative RNA methylase